MTPWVPLAQLDYSKTAVRVSSFFFIGNRVNKLEIRALPPTGDSDWIKFKSFKFLAGRFRF